MSLLLKPQLISKNGLNDNNENLNSWRKEVIRDHFKTKEYAECSLKACRSTREKIQEDFRSTKVMLSKWNMFSNKKPEEERTILSRLTSSESQNQPIACPQSAKTIGSIQNPRMFFHRRNLSANRPTKCYLMKATKKYIAPKNQLRSFAF